MKPEIMTGRGLTSVVPEASRVPGIERVIPTVGRIGGMGPVESSIDQRPEVNTQKPVGESVIGHMTTPVSEVGKPDVAQKQGPVSK